MILYIHKYQNKTYEASFLLKTAENIMDINVKM